MIKGIILGVLVAIVGIAVLILGLVSGSAGGSYLGLLLLVIIAIPVILIVAHRYADQSPGYIFIAYNLVGSLIALMLIVVTTSNPPAAFWALNANQGAANAAWVGTKVLPAIWVALSLLNVFCIFSPVIRRNYRSGFRSADISKFWPILVLFGLMVLFGIGTGFGIILAIVGAFEQGTGFQILKWFGWTFFLPLLIGGLFPWAAIIMNDLQESQFMRETAKRGRGGSSRWAGLKALTERRMSVGDMLFKGYKPDQEKHGAKIFLGETLMQFSLEAFYVGIEDDAHMVTIGTTGSGKSTTVLFNTLPYWGGSLLALDPKGELADFTASQREHNLGNTSYVLDPFEITESAASYRAYFNPLEDIDINDPNATDYIIAIADACVVSEGEEHMHWTEGSMAFIQGLIAHVLSTFPKDTHNLPHIFDLMLGIGDPENADSQDIAKNFGDLLNDMSRNHACGGLPAEGATYILTAGDRAYGAYLSTILRSLRWAGEPRMRKHLANNGESMRKAPLTQLGNSHKKSVYVVLPFKRAAVHMQGRWMRLLLNFGVQAVQSQSTPPNPSTLFVADEFFSLGYSKQIESNVVQLRSAGVKLWLFLQNIGQLKSLYKENWETFTANSNTQIISSNDSSTGEFVSKLLGDSKKGIPLLSPAEVNEELGKDNARQVVIPVSGAPMLLGRVFFEDLVPYEARGTVRSPQSVANDDLIEDVPPPRPRTPPPPIAKPSVEEQPGFRRHQLATPTSVQDNKREDSKGHPEPKDSLEALIAASNQRRASDLYPGEKSPDPFAMGKLADFYFSRNIGIDDIKEAKYLYEDTLDCLPMFSNEDKDGEYAARIQKRLDACNKILENEKTKIHKNYSPSLKDEIKQLVAEWGYEGEDVPEDLIELAARHTERKSLYPESMHKVLDEQFITLKDVFFS